MTASTKSGRGVIPSVWSSGYGQCLIGRKTASGVMSNFRRDGENANSAIIVSVTPDFPVPAPWVEWSSAEAGGKARLLEWKDPLQLYGDFRRTGDRRPWETWRPSSAAAMPFNLRN
ncbi:MAG: hypothetical protein ACLU8D_08210 [Enterocloster sp.]